LNGTFDFGQDIAIVYGTDPSMPRRVRQYRQRGYVVHVMTGIAWGSYQDYLNGKWDGQDHWDEAQRDRDGSLTGIWVHAPDVPYMVPAISYTDYLTEKLRPAIDAGVEAIYTEEPEFLESGAYGEAFKREYQIYYHEPWRPPHESVDAHYRAVRLMSWLYRRAIERVSASLCEYSLGKYGRPLKFYVPTHSLLNYTQWKVPSPEGQLTDIPTLDGYQAQIWMGTSRTPNVYRGVCKERIFETAFLEYGVMQELVRGTGRTMWFNIDPIEDIPKYHWEEYKADYFKTLIAQLLQPHINRYEICPWPNRIFGGDTGEPPKYPRGAPDAKPIPPDYLTLCANIFQTMGTFETNDFSWDRDWGDELPEAGVFLSDTAMFQRSVPDDAKAEQEALCRAAAPGTLQTYPDSYWLANGEYTEIREDVRVAAGHRFDFAASSAFPQFYGLAMPLVKAGLPIRPVQLENIVRYPAYLDNYRLLALSYEFQKPLSADVNLALAGYVQNGGILYYCGDGSDPFHRVRSWWNTGKNSDPSPLENLLRLLGLPENLSEGAHRCGKGSFVFKRLNPADLCLDPALSDAYCGEIAALLGVSLNRNSFALRRGSYLVLAVMDESGPKTPKLRRGLFADMLSTDFDIITEKSVGPDKQALLFDFDTIAGEDLRVIGTSIRVTALDATETGFTLCGCGPSKLRARIRLRLPRRPTALSGRLKPLRIIPLEDENAGAVVEPEALDIPVSFDWDEKTRTALLRFDNTAGDLEITGRF
jgi:hypothetical protein